MSQYPHTTPITSPDVRHVLLRLQHYITTIDLAEVDCPVGLTMSPSGNFQVTYSLGRIPISFKVLDDAVDHVHRFLTHRQF
jgi:hypothetical protein